MTATADSRTVRVDVNGAVDVAAQEMRMEATTDGRSSRTFVLNRTVYQECAFPARWGVEQLDNDTEWVNHTPAGRQLSMLESGSLYWNGTETVGGEPTVVITGEPTADALTKYQDEQSQPLFGGTSVDDVELRAWLDNETGHPLRTELRFTISEGGDTATAMMTTTYGDYGESVSIDLPTEARTDHFDSGCPG